MSEQKKEAQLSVEQIDKHIEKSQMPKGVQEAGAEKATALNLCVAYGKARPVIVFAQSLLFFKPKWQQAVSVLITAIDAACPQK